MLQANIHIYVNRVHTSRWAKNIGNGEDHDLLILKTCISASTTQSSTTIHYFLVLLFLVVLQLIHLSINIQSEHKRRTRNDSTTPIRFSNRSIVSVCTGFVCHPLFCTDNTLHHLSGCFLCLLDGAGLCPIGRTVLYCPASLSRYHTHN